MQLILLETGHFVCLHFQISAQVKKHQTKVINQLTMMAMKIMKRMEMNMRNGFLLQQDLDFL